MSKKLFFLVLVIALALTACDSQVVKDAKATATAMADNAQATQIVAQAQALLNGTPTNMPTPTAPVVSNPATPTQALAQPATANDRIARLVQLDAVYRSSGWQAWLKAADVTCDANVEARQPEEETVVYNGETRVVVSGLQVKGNCMVPYPALVTTDRPGEVTTSADSRTYQPDLKNPSVLYTNVQLHGQGTIWVDGSWGQLDPTK